MASLLDLVFGHKGNYTELSRAINGSSSSDVGMVSINSTWSGPPEALELSNNTEMFVSPVNASNWTGLYKIKVLNDDAWNEVTKVRILVTADSSDVLPLLFVSCKYSSPNHTHYHWRGVETGNLNSTSKQLEITFTTSSIFFAPGWAYISLVSRPGQNLLPKYCIKAQLSKTPFVLSDGHQQRGHVMGHDTRSFIFNIPALEQQKPYFINRIVGPPLSLRAFVRSGQIQICVHILGPNASDPLDVAKHQLRYERCIVIANAMHSSFAKTPAWDNNDQGEYSFAAIDMPAIFGPPAAQLGVVVRGIQSFNDFTVRAIANGVVRLHIDDPGPGDRLVDSLGLLILRRTYYVEVWKASGQEQRNSALKARLCGLDKGDLDKSQVQISAKISNLTTKWEFHSRGHEEAEKDCQTLHVDFNVMGKKYWSEYGNPLVVKFVVHAQTPMSYVLKFEPVHMPELLIGEVIKGTLTEKHRHFSLHWNGPDAATGLRFDQCLGKAGSNLQVDQSETKSEAIRFRRLLDSKKGFYDAHPLHGKLTTLISSVSATPVKFEVALLESERGLLSVPHSLALSWNSNTSSIGFEAAQLSQNDSAWLARLPQSVQKDFHLEYLVVAIPSNCTSLHAETACGLVEAMKHHRADGVAVSKPLVVKAADSKAKTQLELDHPGVVGRQYTTNIYVVLQRLNEPLVARCYEPIVHILKHPPIHPKTKNINNSASNSDDEGYDDDFDDDEDEKNGFLEQLNPVHSTASRVLIAMVAVGALVWVGRDFVKRRRQGYPGSPTGAVELDRYLGFETDTENEPIENMNIERFPLRPR